MITSASGTIRAKIEEHFGDEMSREQRDNLAALIYNPQAEIARRKADSPNFDQWCRETIYSLIVICQSVSTKYTRSKVRKRLPKYWGYAMDELLHADDEANKSHYYSEIFSSIIESGMAEDFICSMADTISSLAVDRLHIIGDVFDRGSHSDEIMDFLMNYHDVDFQWGNHDILWMGAAAGSWACMTNVLRINVRYYNFDMLEIGYGINLRPLSAFALEFYGDDPCEIFMPKIIETSKFDPVDPELAAKMHKAIAICQFKVEGQRIMAHPEYHLQNRMMLDKIDYEAGTIELNGKTYELRDKHFPTIDPADPYKLTPEEERLLRNLEASVLRSEKLQKHIGFMMTHGSLYKVLNGNLMYHGCIPMDADGNFLEVSLNGATNSGKKLFDYLDEQVRLAFFNPKKSEETGHSGDLMWYLWLGARSPLFGKDQMTTFERLFIEDKATHKENTTPYYKLIDQELIVDKILREFGLDPDTSHIISGHGETVSSCIVNDKVIADIYFREHTVDCKFITVFTERSHNIVLVTAGNIFLAGYRNVMICFIYCRAHKIACTRINSDIFLVCVFFMYSLRDQTSVRTGHETSHFCIDRNVSETCRNEHFVIYFFDALTYSSNIVGGLFRGISYSYTS
jgi:Uncharacterized protein conserved in bacteria